VEIQMPKDVSNTYLDVQAVLLNSEREPAYEVGRALEAVLSFAEAEDLPEEWLRSLFEEALRKSKSPLEITQHPGLPDCFGKSYSSSEVLCIGGMDGTQQRAPCILRSPCGRRLLLAEALVRR
jgi:hypothetical protein